MLIEVTETDLVLGQQYILRHKRYCFARGNYGLYGVKHISTTPADQTEPLQISAILLPREIEIHGLLNFEVVENLPIPNVLYCFVYSRTTTEGQLQYWINPQDWTFYENTPTLKNAMSYED